MVSPQDLTYLPEKSRARVARLINEGSQTATHIQVKSGTGLQIPDPDLAIVNVVHDTLWNTVVRSVDTEQSHGNDSGV